MNTIYRHTIFSAIACSAALLAQANPCGVKKIDLLRSRRLERAKSGVLLRSRHTEGTKSGVLLHSGYTEGIKSGVLLRSGHTEGIKSGVLLRSGHTEGIKSDFSWNKTWLFYTASNFPPWVISYTFLSTAIMDVVLYHL